MLDRGAKIQNKDKDGSTCVHYAAFGGDKQCLKLIIKKIKKGKEGLSISSVDKNKQCVSILYFKLIHIGHLYIMLLVMEWLKAVKYLLYFK